MGLIKTGVPITGYFTPYDTRDTYAVTDSRYGLGGWHEVADTTERDLIPDARLRLGMAVYTTLTSETWILTTLTTNVSPYVKAWTLLSTGAGTQRDVTFVLRGDLVAGDDVTNTVTIASAGTITGARVVMSTAPVGANAIFDIKCNDTPIAETGDRLTVIDGATTGVIATLDVTTFTSPSDFALDIVQVGSTTPGGWAIITLSLELA